MSIMVVKKSNSRPPSNMAPASLKAWRERRNWSKTEAARQLGISTNAYSYYESGRWPIKKIVALACAALALGIKPHE